MERDPVGDSAVVKRLGYNGVRNRRAIVESSTEAPRTINASYPCRPTPDGSTFDDEDRTAYDRQPDDAFRTREHGQPATGPKLRPLPGQKVKDIGDKNGRGDFGFHAAHAKKDLELIESQIAEEKYFDRPVDFKKLGNPVRKHHRAGSCGQG